MSSFGFRVFTLALAVFFFFETAIAGIKSASVYAESDSAGGKKSGFLKPGIGGKSAALQGGNKRLRIPLAPYKFRHQTRKPVLNPSRDPVTRGGIWSKKALSAFYDLQRKEARGHEQPLFLNYFAPGNPIVGTSSPANWFSNFTFSSFSLLQSGGPSGPGRGHPWEFGSGGGGTRIRRHESEPARTGIRQRWIGCGNVRIG